MNNNLDLKDLWNKQGTTVPDAKELFEKLKTFKKNNFYKLIFANVTLLFTSAFIGFIWYFYQPKMITTKVGIILAIMAMTLYLIVYNKMISLLIHDRYDMNGFQYLQQLLKLKEKQLFLQKTMLNIYFILLSTGLCLYMIEYTTRMTLFWASFFYGITLVWILINWLFFRPRTIKKQQAKINELIRRFEELSRQLTTHE